MGRGDHSKVLFWSEGCGDNHNTTGMAWEVAQSRLDALLSPPPLQPAAGLQPWGHRLQPGALDRIIYQKLDYKLCAKAPLQQARGSTDSGEFLICFFFFLLPLQTPAFSQLTQAAGHKAAARASPLFLVYAQRRSLCVFTLGGLLKPLLLCETDKMCARKTSEVA